MPHRGHTLMPRHGGSRSCRPAAVAAHAAQRPSYSHPVTDQRRATYGKDALMGWPKYDHYSSELVLLYAIAIGCLELDNFVGCKAFKPMQASHLCHHHNCIVAEHITWEAYDANLDRKECHEEANDLAD